MVRNEICAQKKFIYERKLDLIIYSSIVLEFDLYDRKGRFVIIETQG